MEFRRSMAAGIFWCSPRLGVPRVSLGLRPIRATLALFQRMAEEIQQEGMFTKWMSQEVAYDKMNRWFL